MRRKDFGRLDFRGDVGSCLADFITEAFLVFEFGFGERSAGRRWNPQAGGLRHMGRLLRNFFINKLIGRFHLISLDILNKLTGFLNPLKTKGANFFTGKDF